MAKKKKILYLFSDTGGGHRSAATALIRAVEERAPGRFHQEMIDVFATCSGFLNVFARLYGPVIKFSPRLWGQLYYWLDDERKLEQLEKISRPFILKAFKKLLLKIKPDLIVSVHPLVNHLTVKALKELKLTIPFMVVITDPVTLHRAWITPEVERCIVATSDARQNALRYGMPAKKLKVIGMPIDPKFSRQAPAKKRKEFTVLLMGGGEGAGRMGEIVDEFYRAGFSGRLLVIAGRNRKLEKDLRRRSSRFPFPVEVFGFTDQVYELMGRSDMIITKAGPGTIAEALAMGLPIVITSWLPGQEEGNVDFVVKSGTGWVSKEPKKVVSLVRKMMKDKRAFSQIKSNIKKVSRPQAALDIAKEILSFV